MAGTEGHINHGKSSRKTRVHNLQSDMPCDHTCGIVQPSNPTISRLVHIVVRLHVIHPYTQNAFITLQHSQPREYGKYRIQSNGKRITTIQYTCKNILAYNPLSPYVNTQPVCKWSRGLGRPHMYRPCWASSASRKSRASVVLFCFLIIQGSLRDLSVHNALPALQGDIGQTSPGGDQRGESLSLFCSIAPCTDTQQRTAVHCPGPVQ